MTSATLSRRAVLLSSGFALTVAAAPLDAIRLRPGEAAGALVTTEPPAGDVMRIWVGGIGEPVELPATRARRLANLPIAGRELMVVAFAADLPGLCSQDVAALIGWDGARLRILGLETLSWRRRGRPPPGEAQIGRTQIGVSQGGASQIGNAQYDMHLAGTPDRQHLALGCLAQLGRPVTSPFRLAWTDFLGWQDGAPLADARAGAAMAGSWPAELAAVRRKVAALLATPTTRLTLDGLTGTGILNQFSCMADR